jgi:GNAT superfamily N-acetyltransferase
VQVLVLPPVQGCGYGKALIQAAYFLARQREAVDLTVSLSTVAQDLAGSLSAAVHT